MWGTLLGLAFFVAINPVLLAVILLMISRPRPVPNLLAYWVGGMIVNLTCLLVPLMVLDLIPTFATFSEEITVPNTSANSAIRFVQIGMGVVMLATASLMTVRSWVRRRAHQPISGRDSSVLLLDSDSPGTVSPLGPLGDPATEGGSAIRRLLTRLQHAWDNGALWVAFVFGVLGLPPPLVVLFVDTTIVASGAGLGMQIFAVIAFVVAMFAVVEIALLSYLAAPAKTKAILQPLHDWALARRRQVLAVIFAMVGLFTVAKGIGIV